MIATTKQFKPLKWFENRVGKKIHRKAVDCQCSACKDGTENGILVHDKDHAEYLYNVQLDLGIEYKARPYILQERTKKPRRTQK